MSTPKNNKLVVYLIKPEYKEPEEIIESSQDGVDIDGIGTFYFEDSGVGTPSWVKDFFGGKLAASVKLFTASARGVLLVPIQPWPYCPGTNWDHFVAFNKMVGRILGAL